MSGSGYFHIAKAFGVKELPRISTFTTPAMFLERMLSSFPGMVVPDNVVGTPRIRDEAFSHALAVAKEAARADAKAMATPEASPAQQSVFTLMVGRNMESLLAQDLIKGRKLNVSGVLANPRGHAWASLHHAPCLVVCAAAVQQ